MTVDLADEILAALDAYDAGALDESVDEPDPIARRDVVAGVLERHLRKN